MGGNLATSTVKSRKTIQSVVEAGLCTGCGTCVGICPNDAVQMMIDRRKGIYVPQLDRERCNECGICFDVCPGHGIDLRQLNLEIFGKESQDVLLGNYLSCYIGHATDYDIRYNSASGGLVTALLIFALEEGMIDGALVTRMKKDKPLEPEPFIARTREEMISASKSKYCPVPANVMVKEILKAKERERFAVVGLPCHIHGIRKAERINKNLGEKIVLHLGITCSHSASFLGTEFLIRRYKLSNEDIINLDYRGQGWPGFMTIRLKEGRTRVVPYQKYITFHELGFFTPLRCLMCPDFTGSLADISFADAWLPEVRKREKVGESLLLSRSETGEEMLQKAELGRKIEINRLPSPPGTVRGGGKKVTSDILSYFMTLVGKKTPAFGHDTKLPRKKLTAYPLSLLTCLNIAISKRSLFWLISPLARVERMLINMASRTLRR